jgi:hypothetical protein
MEANAGDVKNWLQSPGDAINLNFIYGHPGTFTVFPRRALRARRFLRAAVFKGCV